MLALHLLHTVLPLPGLELHLFLVGVVRHHSESLAQLRIARADVSTVAASETVENRNLNGEVHALHGCGSLHVEGLALVALHLLVGHNERTDGSVRTDICTLVALDAVVDVPSRNESLHTTLLVSGSANLPRTVDSAVLHKVADLQQVAGLSVDGTNQFLHECGSVVLDNSVVGQAGPLGLHLELLELTATVDGSIVLVDNILAFGSIRLQGGSLHLLNGKLHGDYLGDAEER